YGRTIDPDELPGSIETKLITRLVDEKLIKRQKGNSMKQFISLAAAVLLIAAAFWLGTLPNQQEKNQVSEKKNEFLLIVYDEANTEKDDYTIAMEYRKWMSTPFKNGSITGGQELQMSGEQLSGTGDQFEAMQIAPEKSVSGYFIIAADTYADAMTIAKTCPHLSYNGKLELRPFMYR
ncbi:MAG: hypothetical protein KDD94_11745, partial [Calditrichaeota bacterium]|nr:hypothetical protein [Calditrichota bacterium]